MGEMSKGLLAVIALLVIALSMVIGYTRGQSVQYTAEERLVQMTTTTTEDAIADGIALAGPISAFESYHRRIMDTKFRDITEEQKEETDQLIRKLHAAPVKTMLGKAVASYISSAIMYDRIACGSVLATFREKGVFTEEDGTQTFKIVKNAQDCLDFGNIFYAKLMKGKKDFEF